MLKLSLETAGSCWPVTLALYSTWFDQLKLLETAGRRYVKLVKARFYTTPGCFFNSIKYAGEYTPLFPDTTEGM